MSDFDFLKEFGKNLDKEQPHEPSDADWEKLATSLNAQARSERRRRAMLAWAFPLAASLVFALLGTLLWQTRSRAEVMQDQITRLQMELTTKKSISMTDTTVQRITLIRYDTIYRTVVVRSVAPLTGASTFYAKNTDQSTDSIFQKNQGLHLAISKKGQITASTGFQNTQQATAVLVDRADLTAQADANTLGQSPDLDSLSSKLDLSMLPLKDIRPPISHHKEALPNAFDMTVMVPAPPRAPMPMIRRLRPHNAIVGVTGGILFPQTQNADPFDNYTFGLNGQLAFGRHIRLLAGAAYGTTTFRVKNFALDNFNIPTLSPPTSNDVLDFVEVNQPLWDFSLGMRYVFVPEMRLRPFIGAAWVGEQTLEQTLRYGFKNQVSEEETYTLVPRNNARFDANGLQIGLGAEWALAKRFTFGLEGVYQRQYNTSVPLLAERWGLKLGLGYSF